MSQTPPPQRGKTTTLYHSQLCQMGETIVFIKKGTRPSRYPNKPPYAILAINGQEYSFPCDSQAVENFFQGNDGRTMLVKAGGRDQGAYIEYIEEIVGGSQHQPQQHQQHQQPAQHQAPPPPPTQQRQSAPPPPGPAPANYQQPPAQRTAPPPPAQPPQNRHQETPEEAVKKMKAVAMRLSNVYQVSWAAAQHAREMIKAQRGEEMTPDQIQSATASIFIQLTRDGWQERIPAKPIGIGTPPPDPAESKEVTTAQQPANDGNDDEPADDVPM